MRTGSVHAESTTDCPGGFYCGVQRVNLNICGKEGEKGVIASGFGDLEIVDVASVGEDQLLVHDEKRPDPTLAFALSRLADSPTTPTPMGVFRAVERAVYGDAMNSQIEAAQERQGRGDLTALLDSGSTWEV